MSRTARPPGGREAARVMVREARSLPCLSDAAVRLLRAAQDPEVPLLDVRDILAQDMALASRVLKVANSAYYSRSRAVASIDQAIVVLGVDAVRNIAIASSLERITRSGKLTQGFHLRDLWRHSVITGVLSQLVAVSCLPARKDEAFLAGLLHDLGMLAAVHLRPKQVGDVVARLAAPHPGADVPALLQAEREVLGVTHDDLGAALLEQWQFPEAVIEAVSAHHRGGARQGADTGLVPLVIVADRLSHERDGELPIERTGDDPDAAAPAELNTSWEALEAMIRSRIGAVQDLGGALGI